MKKSIFRSTQSGRLTSTGLRGSTGWNDQKCRPSSMLIPVACCSTVEPSSLGSGAPLVLYGPFVEPDVETAASNHAFDQSLRQRDPAWGLRSTADLDRLAAGHGMTRTARCAMPANNLVLVYRRD